MNPPRRFFLEVSPIEGAPRLADSDTAHALRVLRLGEGDRLLGLDGRGHEWCLEVARAERRELQLRALGDAREEPAPGAEGAPLPWIEVCCPLPKASRAETMLSRLTQLGIARYVPLVSERCEPQAREASPARLAKLERTARESLKQCGRLWLPEIALPRSLDEGLGPAKLDVLLDHDAEDSLARLLAATSEKEWTRERPLRLIAGPEGGFSPAERAALEEQGARPARLGPHVLRIETAVEAALAVVVVSTSA